MNPNPPTMTELKKGNQLRSEYTPETMHGHGLVVAFHAEMLVESTPLGAAPFDPIAAPQWGPRSESKVRKWALEELS